MSGQEDRPRWLCPECKKPTAGVMRAIMVSPCCLRPLEFKDLIQTEVERPCGSCATCLAGDGGSCDAGGFNIFKGSGSPGSAAAGAIDAHAPPDLAACDALLEQLGVDPDKDEGEHDSPAAPGGAAASDGVRALRGEAEGAAGCAMGAAIPGGAAALPAAGPPLRLEVGGQVLASEMVDGVRVIREFKPSHVSLVDVPAIPVARVEGTEVRVTIGGEVLLPQASEPFVLTRKRLEDMIKNFKALPDGGPFFDPAIEAAMATANVDAGRLLNRLELPELPRDFFSPAAVAERAAATARALAADPGVFAKCINRAAPQQQPGAVRLAQTPAPGLVERAAEYDRHFADCTACQHGASCAEGLALADAVVAPNPGVPAWTKPPKLSNAIAGEVCDLDQLLRWRGGSGPTEPQRRKENPTWLRFKKYLAAYHDNRIADWLRDPSNASQISDAEVADWRARHEELIGDRTEGSGAIDRDAWAREQIARQRALTLDALAAELRDRWGTSLSGRVRILPPDPTEAMLASDLGLDLKTARLAIELERQASERTPEPPLTDEALATRVRHAWELARRPVHLDMTTLLGPGPDLAAARAAHPLIVLDIPGKGLEEERARFYRMVSRQASGSVILPTGSMELEFIEAGSSPRWLEPFQRELEEYGARSFPGGQVSAPVLGGSYMAAAVGQAMLSERLKEDHQAALRNFGIPATWTRARRPRRAAGGQVVAWPVVRSLRELRRVVKWKRHRAGGLVWFSSPIGHVGVNLAMRDARWRGHLGTGDRTSVAVGGHDDVAQWRSGYRTAKDARRAVERACWAAIERGRRQP